MVCGTALATLGSAMHVNVLWTTIHRIGAYVGFENGEGMWGIERIWGVQTINPHVLYVA